MLNKLVKRVLSVVISTVCLTTVGCTDINTPGTGNTDNIVKNKGFNVHFIDVGQGDSTLLECDGEYMLIDAGEIDKGEDVVKYLEKYNVDKLEYAVITHPHTDHYGGMQQVLEDVTVEKIIMTEAYSTTYKWEKLIDYIDENNYNVIFPKSNDTFTIGDCTLTTFVPYDYGDNLNNASIIFNAEYKGMSALFTGDAEKPAEEQAITSGFNVSANLLSAGHHGSSTSTGKKLFNSAKPQLAVISCGKNNDYGHPHKEITSLFKKNNVPYLRTDEQGSIVVNMADDKISVSTDKGYTTVINGKRVDNSSSLIQEENYVGNKKSKVVHSKGCSSLNKMKEENKVYFNSLDTALEKGYRLCEDCKEQED